MKEIDVPVTITQEDIDRGKRYDASFCPLNYALRRVVKGIITVGATCFVLDEIALNLPPDAFRFRADFDRNRGVAPCVILFALPEILLKGAAT